MMFLFLIEVFFWRTTRRSSSSTELILEPCQKSIPQEHTQAICSVPCSSVSRDFVSCGPWRRRKSTVPPAGGFFVELQILSEKLFRAMSRNNFVATYAGNLLGSAVGRKSPRTQARSPLERPSGREKFVS